MKNKMPKPKFEKEELKAFKKLYNNLVEAGETTNLVLYHGQPYSFAVIAHEIFSKTPKGREFLDKIKRIGI